MLAWTADPDRVRSRYARSALFVAVGLILAACASNGGEASPETGEASPTSETGESSSWDQVLQAADEEGTVVWYTAMLADIAADYVAEFEQAYPNITVETVADSGQGIIERFEGEARVGRSVSDVVLTSVPQAVVHWKDEGWLAEVDLPEAEAMDPETRDPDGAWYFHYITGYGLQYNTNAVDESELPETWNELFDERWTDRMGLNPPWRSGVGAAWAMWLEEELGVEDPATRFAALNPHIAGAPGDLADGIVRGEYDVGPQLDYIAYAQMADGAPVSIHFPPEDPIMMTPRVTAISADAPHPNAAMVFLNWQLSREANEFLMQEHYFGSVRDDVTSFPDVMVDYTQREVHLPDITRPLSDQDPYVEKWEAALAG